MNNTTGTTCGQALVKLLETFGVNTVFGIPGVHTVELYRGLSASGIRHITPRHEQGAGFMADGYARATGKPGVCFVITGPGVTNIATAMAQAYSDSVPMLVISSVNEREHLGRGEGRLHELPNQQALMAGVSAFSETLTDPAELPRLLTRAFTVFRSGRPRPVHIEIPLDLLAASTAPPIHAMPAMPPRPAPPAGQIDAAVKLLAQAQEPVLLLGGGCVDTGTSAQRLAELLDAPTLLTINAKGLLPPGHPLLLGSTQSLQPVRKLVSQADLVLAIGTELGETDYDVVFDGGFEIPGRLIRIDIEASQLHRGFQADLAICSDAGLAITALLECLGDSRAERRGAQRVAVVREQLAANWPQSALLHEKVLDVVHDCLPGALFVGDSTQPVYSGNYLFDASEPRTWFNSSTGFGTLGYGLPAAIGARLGQPHRPVVALVGDGGIQFTLAELGAAIEAGTPVIVLLWNNDGYGEIRNAMRSRDIQPVGVDLFTPDFLAIARGYGWHAERARSLDALREYLGQAAQRPLPTLIEIREEGAFKPGADAI